MQFHITYNKPTGVWPDGCWSLYKITADEIANRIVFTEVVPESHLPAFYKGPVIARHSWCGFIGCYGSIVAVSAEITKHVAGVA